MPGTHAVLSPSASGRWIECPASIRMCQGIEQEDNVYAQEGTQFHSLAEITARHRLLDGGDMEYVSDMLEWELSTNESWKEDQRFYLENWLVFLEDALQEEPGSRLLIEQRVDTGVPGCWGTADAVIINDNTIRVIDIKYGAGVRVDSTENSQLMLYGAGALNLADDPLKIRDVTVTVWQPRVNNISDYTLSRSELVKWRDGLIPIAKSTQDENAPFGPSEDACRWCPAAGICKPRMKHVLNQDFGNSDVMTGQEMAEAFDRTTELKKWISDIEDAALKRAYEDNDLPGFKVVRSGGRRKILDPEKAVERLLNANFAPEEVCTRRPLTLAQLEKAAGSPEELQQVLGDLLVKGEGRLSLAPDSDPRPPADAVNSAQEDFAEIE